MSANRYHLRYTHAGLEHLAQTFVAQIVKLQICDASSVAQSVPSLTECNICDWKDAVRGSQHLFKMLERELAERHLSRPAVFGYRE